MRKIIYFFALILVVGGCGGGSSYDKGYDDGYDGASKSVLYKIDKKYRYGYEDGVEDYYEDEQKRRYYNMGCDDANSGYSPQYPDIDRYMEGYYGCK